MKTKLVFFAFVSFAGACITIFVFCIFYSWVFIAIPVLLVAIVVICSLAAIILYRRFMRKRVIDPKIDLKRNYDRIMLGEMSKQEDITDNTLDLRGYHRNAYTDILLAERYYSFLKQDGCIDIFVPNSDYYQNSNRINQIDYPLLHPVTLLEHGISALNYRFALLNPIVGLIYMLSRIVNIMSTNGGGAISVDVFEPLICFCKERNVGLHIHSSEN